MTVWIIVANASAANIYETEHLKKGNYHLVETFQHPESREKGADLVSDRSGHFQTNTTARSAYENADPKKVEAERFICDMAHHVKHESDRNKFDELYLVMPAHIHGFFMKHFTSKFSNIQHISKDYTKHSVDELVKLISQ